MRQRSLEFQKRIVFGRFDNAIPCVTHRHTQRDVNALAISHEKCHEMEIWAFAIGANVIC